MQSFKTFKSITILQEAVNYEQMFDSIINVFGETKAKKRVEDGIKKQIKKAKELKKSDRAIWYLRNFKLILLQSLKKSLEVTSGKDDARVYLFGFDILDFDSPEEVKEVEKKFNTLYQKEIKKYSDKEIKQNNDFNDFNRIYNMLLHFLSLPIREIQDLTWEKQTDTELVDFMNNAEEQWKQKNQDKEQYIRVDENNDEIIKKIGDYYWVDLERAYCPKEGKAMGHCGNSPRQSTGDNIYSLRKLIKVGDEKYWHPFVTVTVDEHGMVWEVKGRGNDKPAEKYIPYVVELFKMKKYIKGQRTGVGYMPENNLVFDRDFTEEQKEEIRDANPNFKMEELEPLILELDEYETAYYILAPDNFDVYGGFNRQPTDEEWEYGLDYKTKYNIRSYNRLMEYGFDVYKERPKSAKENIDDFVKFFENPQNAEDKETAKEAVYGFYEDLESLFDDLYLENEEYYVDKLDNEEDYDDQEEYNEAYNEAIEEAYLEALNDLENKEEWEFAENFFDTFEPNFVGFYVTKMQNEEEIAKRDAFMTKYLREKYKGNKASQLDDEETGQLSFNFESWNKLI